MGVLNLGTGSIYRLAFGPSIKKGNWYHGVQCHLCKQPILLFDDNTKGSKKLTMVGDSKLSIPCAQCGADELYVGSEMKQFMAARNIRSYREKRPVPTGSPRQPLLPKYKNAKVSFGIGAVEQRPEAAVIIARCIAYWTYVEAETARLLSTILKANTAPAVAVYLSLQNARAKTDAMNAAASTTLDANDLELYRAIIAYKSSVEKERNALAHGIIGITEQIKDGIVWTDTTKYTHFQVRNELDGLTEKLQSDRQKTWYVYLIGDLETIARDIENVHAVIGSFLGYLSTQDASFRAMRYPQLCAEPRVQKELTRLRQKTPQEDTV
jgi:hypothetical protein